MTCKSGRRGSKIDHSLCRKKHLKEVKNCKVMVGECVAKHHRMVICQLKMIVKKRKRFRLSQKSDDGN